VGDIDFKAIFAPENSKKFQKTRFWKEKSVEDMDEFTLGPTAQANTNILKNVKGEEKMGQMANSGKKNCSSTLCTECIKSLSTNAQYVTLLQWKKSSMRFIQIVSIDCSLFLIG
jgi:hypothetical protein